MAFQYPVEIPGVSNQFFLQTALNAVRAYRGLEALDRFDFQDLMEEKIKLLKMPEDLANSFGERWFLRRREKTQRYSANGGA